MVSAQPLQLQVTLRCHDNALSLVLCKWHISLLSTFVIKSGECHLGGDGYVGKLYGTDVPKDTTLELRGGVWLNLLVSKSNRQEYPPVIPCLGNYEATFICHCNIPPVSALLFPLSF